MSISGAFDAVSRHDQGRVMGQPPAPQAGVQVVGVILQLADLDHDDPKTHPARGPEAALGRF